MTSGGNMDFHGALNDSKAASFFDGAREGVFAFMIVVCLGFIAITTIDSHVIPLFWQFALVVLIAFLIMVLVGRMIGGIARRRAEQEATEYRAGREAETKRLIAEMKARDET